MLKVTSSSAAGAAPPSRARGARRGSAAGLAALMAFGTIPALTVLGTSAHADVTVGSNVSAFPYRDMVVAVGYELGENLLVEVLRNDVVIGTTQGPAAETPEGIGLEVNHGPLGAPLPGDCWVNYTPDILAGDVIRVTAVDRVGQPADTMTVADVNFTVGEPYLHENGWDVIVAGKGTVPLADVAVEFRRDKPTPRFRRGPLLPISDGAGGWTATFKPTTATSPEGLTREQQRDIALNEASWAAVVDNISNTTLVELGEPGGVGPGCTGQSEPNSLVEGLDPINATARDVTFSGTTRPGVTDVTVAVGSLTKQATVNRDARTWSLVVPYTELQPLPEGNLAVTPSFITTTETGSTTFVGTTLSILKDTGVPGAPVPSVPAGTYGGPQSVALNKPAGEGTSKVYWEIGPTGTVPDPDQFSSLYTTQINVTTTQTIKGVIIDAAGNRGPVGTFDYKIGNPPPAPAGLSGGEVAPAGSARLTWTAASGATGYNLYRSNRLESNVKVNGSPITVTNFTDTGLKFDTHSYVVRAVEANGIESTNSNTALVTVAPPDVPTGLTATPGDGRVTLSWTRVTGATSYTIYRDGVAVTTVSGTTTSYTNTGLLNQTPYDFTITSLDQFGNESAKSTVAQATPADTTPPPAPTVSVASGSFNSPQTVTMANTEAGAVIRYTVGDGTTVPADPTVDSTQYTGAITVSTSQVIKAAAFDAVGNRSPITQRNYTIDTVAPPAPSVSPATGTYASAQTVTATNTEAGVTHRYTIATGTTVPGDPTATSTVLPAGGVTVGSSSVIKVRAYDAAGNASPVVQRDYTITQPDTTAPPAPTVDPASGTYTSAQNVTATNTEAGVTHRYTIATGTTAPADPTATSTVLPAGGLPVSSSAVVKIRSYDAANNGSTVVQRNYTISSSTTTTRTVVITPEGDTMAKQATPTTGFGTAYPLYVDSQDSATATGTAVHGYLRFNVTGLATGERVTGAQLRLRTMPTDGGTNNGPAIWRTANTSTATASEAVTWNTRPARSGTSAAGNYGSMGHGAWVDATVSGITGNGVVSFELAPESTDPMHFRPREDGTTTNRPQLILTVTSGG